MAATQVQFKTATGTSGPTISATFDGATASGNTIIAHLTGRVGSSSPASFTSSDSFANGYTTFVSTQNGGLTQVVAQMYAFNIAGGASHAVTISTSNIGSGLALIIEEWSGLTTTSPADKKAASAGSSTSPQSSTTPGLIQADELAVACGNARTQVLTAGTGYTLTTNSIGLQQMAAEYQVLASTDQINATFNTTASANWAVAVGTYTIAADGGAVVIRLRDNLLLLGIT